MHNVVVADDRKSSITREIAKAPVEITDNLAVIVNLLVCPATGWQVLLGRNFLTAIRARIQGRHLYFRVQGDTESTKPLYSTRSRKE